MHKLSDIAIAECVRQLRAASRRPVEPAALDTIVSWLRPQFERILDRTDGRRRWALHGQRVRDKSRYLGVLGDFFASSRNADVVGLEELSNAVKLSKADCTVRGHRVPVAYEYCGMAPVDARCAEEFLSAVAPAPAFAHHAV